MNVQDFLPEITHTLEQGMRKITFGKFSIAFTVHEGRIVSIDESFTNNVKHKIKIEADAAMAVTAVD